MKKFAIALILACVVVPAQAKRNIIVVDGDKINVIGNGNANAGAGVRDNPNACQQSALACNPAPVVEPPVVQPPVTQPPVTQPPVVQPPVVQPPAGYTMVSSKVVPCVLGWAYCKENGLTEAKVKGKVIDEVIYYEFP